ncbi:hypothetical protein RRG08_038154 [Elysia crispata]|uniref:Uncharacterized protein n=1 Tax=Elysia crispata TaxID=231223 RepID=A0AAE1D3M7_9GAST|nr:hypothetical protein RRG08_038154 [Elysia crispata]
MVSHLTKYLTENGHINASVQNGGTSTISGCLEHATMIWEAILRAKSEKLNFDVIWLDLANNCGSVPHQMIQLALRLYHVPEDIQTPLRLNGMVQDEIRTKEVTQPLNNEAETSTKIHLGRIEMGQSEISLYVRGFRGPGCEDSTTEHKDGLEQTNEKVLSSCKSALSQGRYKWRQNRVLQGLATIISTAKGDYLP